MPELVRNGAGTAKPGSTPGFLLSRHWRDRPDGVEFQLWVTTPHGPARLTFPGNEVVFFIAATDLDHALQHIRGELHHYRHLSLRTFGGVGAVACYFRSQRALTTARQHLIQAGIEVLEGDLRPVERFLMERFVRGSIEIEGAARHSATALHYHQPVIGPGSWKPRLTVVSLDIETAVDRLELFSIGVVADDLQLVFMAGEGVAADGLHYCGEQKALLLAFMDWLQHRDPDLIIGWNVINFDLWYLQRLCNQFGIPFAIGRESATPYWQALDDAGGRHLCDVPGRVVLDGIEVIKAAQYRFDSYSLQFVASQWLGQGKLLQGQHRGEQIEEMFEQDKPALAAYNLQDCALVWQIFEQRGLIDFCIARSQLTGLALGRVGGSVAAFDYRYLPLLHRQGYVAPAAPALDHARHSPGGYVLDSRPGLYHKVLVFDFKSLYPSIIRTFFIDPMGLAVAADEADPGSVVEGFNGARFSRHQHLLPGLLEELWRAREAARTENDTALAQAIKILMNSFYGVLGSPGCRFFDSRLSSSITLRGHDIIQQSRAYIEQQGYQVIYGDTDSLFVWAAQELPEQEVLALGRRLARQLNHWWQQRLQRELGLDSMLEVEFETLFIRFLMPTVRGAEKGSKKRYAGTVRIAEGDDPSAFKLVFKGLETVRSDWTALARRFQQELYRRVFADQAVASYVRDTHSALMAGQLDEQLVYRKRLRQPLEDYVRNVPPHVRAARQALEAGARPGLFQRGRAVEYLITKGGPEAVGFASQALDYQHYAERQLAPIADGILSFLGTSFADIVDGQMALF